MFSVNVAVAQVPDAVPRLMEWVKDIVSQKHIPGPLGANFRRAGGRPILTVRLLSWVSNTRVPFVLLSSYLFFISLQVFPRMLLWGLHPVMRTYPPSPLRGVPWGGRSISQFFWWYRLYEELNHHEEETRELIEKRDTYNLLSEQYEGEVKKLQAELEAARKKPADLVV